MRKWGLRNFPWNIRSRAQWWHTGCSEGPALSSFLQWQNRVTRGCEALAFLTLRSLCLPRVAGTTGISQKMATCLVWETLSTETWSKSRLGDDNGTGTEAETITGPGTETETITGLGTETGTETNESSLVPRWHLGSFGRTGQVNIPSKNAASLHCGCLCSQVHSNRTGATFLLALARVCPSEWCQAPLRYWFGPNFPLVW